jgi:hypothetical protein
MLFRRSPPMQARSLQSGPGAAGGRPPAPPRPGAAAPPPPGAAPSAGAALPAVVEITLENFTTVIRAGVPIILDCYAGRMMLEVIVRSGG